MVKHAAIQGIILIVATVIYNGGDSFGVRALIVTVTAPHRTSKLQLPCAISFDT